MTRVVVTGSAGKLGRATVRDLVEHGYEVLGADLRPPAEELCPFVAVDLEDFGQTLELLSAIDRAQPGPVDAVVHLAAIPAPGLTTNATVFRRNTLTTWNVFEAARRQGITNVVWASSETVLGLPFDTPPPYVPVDEEYPGRPESAYSLSKHVGEQMAEQFCRWDPAQKIVGLRFSNVMEPHDYARFPSFADDPASRRWNLWGYIDARDGAQAVRLALEAPLTGAEVFVIANAETVLARPNAELLDEFYPGVERRGDIGVNETLLSIAKARRVLGFEPRHPWRDAAAG